MSDTFFSGAPHWTWFIIPYFFVGGLAGGAYFLAALLEWFGRPDDRPVIRTGYRVAAVGAIVSGALLTIDLGRPLRFWHMLFQSENFPAIMFKGWSPISFGAWAILVFGLFSVLSALGAMAEEGRLQNAALRAVGGAVRGGLAKVVSGLGGWPDSSSRATRASCCPSRTDRSGPTAPGWGPCSSPRGRRPARPRCSCSLRRAGPRSARSNGSRRSTPERSWSSSSS